MAEDEYIVPPPKRFAEEQTRFVNPDAPVKHFVPIPKDKGVSRDRFGNRLFASNELSYFDREVDPVKAALLLTPEGERFIKNNPGVLNDIDRGLIELDYRLKPGHRFQTIDEINLGNNRKLSRMSGGEGAQSYRYVLDIGSDKFLIKIRAAQRMGADVSQPYINELLQSQAIQVDLRNVLDASKVELPVFMFASGQVLCRKFEEGIEPSLEELNPRLFIFIPEVIHYIENQRKLNNQLWKNIFPDILQINGIRTRTNNFLLKADGKIVWIDPFVYA